MHYFGEILYNVPVCGRKGDPRFHQRQTFGSLSNRESLVACLPVPRVRMVSRKRTHFSACGETTTHASTYTSAYVRPWRPLPTLTLEDKEKICEEKMPTYAEEDYPTLANGHPLFWLETKEVELFLALFSDLGAHHIFDLAAGSGAAAMAAAILRIHYEYRARELAQLHFGQSHVCHCCR